MLSSKSLSRFLRCASIVRVGLSVLVEVTTPFCRFGQLLQHLVAPNDETAHVGRQKKPVRNSAQNTKWWFELESVAHQRARGMLGKLVIVKHPLERTRNHDVLKVIRAVERSHTHRQPLPDSKVPRLSSDLVTNADQPARHAGDGPLLSAAGRVLMCVDAESEVKDPLPRRANHGG